MRKKRRFKVTTPTSKKNKQNKNCHLKSQQKPASVWKNLSKSTEVPKVDNCVLSKEQRIRKHNSSEKGVLFRYVYSENSTKRFLAQPRGHMGTEERLKDKSRHTLEAVFQLMRVVVNYPKASQLLLQAIW